MLINLALNAMDAVADLPEGRRSIEVSADDRSEQAVITVRDRGRGINLEQLPKLFRIVLHYKDRRHGAGPVDCAHNRRSAQRPGLGRKRPPGGGGLSCRTAQSPRRRRRIGGGDMIATPLIHIVDDDKSMRTALQRLLGKAGFQTRVLWIDRGVPARTAAGSTGLPATRCATARPVRPRTAGGSPAPERGAAGDLSDRLRRRRLGVRAMKAGAVDFLEKPVEPDMLFAAVRRALTRSTRYAQTRGRTAGMRTSGFATSSERHVFHSIVAGKLNKQIAHELGVSERTVKTYRSELMAKLGANSAADLGRMAEQSRRALGRDKAL